MATTKTIQPTGETITIPAMTDRPDVSVFSTDVSRITDAVNSQNQALAKYGNVAGTRITSGSDLNSVTTAGNYYVDSTSDAANIGNMPFNSGGRLEVTEINGSSRLRQIFFTNSSHPDVYVRSLISTGWTTWEKLAYASDIAALPALASFPQKNSLTSRAFNIPNNARLFIYSPAADADAGSYALMCSCNSSGTVKIFEIAKGSRMSFATATNRLTINASASTQYGPAFMMGTNAESVTEIE